MSGFDPTKHHPEDDNEDVKSRTQIKREMEALQDIGKKLTELETEQLKEVPMGEDLRAAIDLYRNNITQREARRRQMQYIGKLMRAEDAEAMQAVIDKYDSSSKAFAQTIHEIEAWRTRLIDEGNQAMTDFMEKHPTVDAQRLRTLVRNAKKDVEQDKNKGAAKKLFQFLREFKNAL
jgi:ribosome-associated protein